MNSRLTRIAPLLLFVSAPMFAQDATTAPKIEARKSQGGAALVVKTNDHEVATGMAESFEVQGEVPEAKDGFYVITLDDGGKAKVAVQSGKAGFMEINARPGMLMEIFADKIEQARGMAQGMGTMALQQSGMKTKDAVKLIQAIFDFPKQIDTFELKIANKPEHPRKDGMDVDMHMTAVAGSGFAEFMAAMQPNGQGAPQLPSGGMMSMAVSMDGKGIAKMMTPLMGFFTPLMGKTEADIKNVTMVMEKSMALIDGAMAMEFTGEGMNILAGLTDTKAYADLLASPEYKSFSKMGSPAGDLEFTEKAFEHRKINVSKSVLKPKEGSELPPNPLFGDGPMESYTAAAGNYMIVTAGGAKDGVIKGMIDQALDQKIKRAPLGNGALMIMDVNVAKLSEKMGGAADEDAPEKLNLAIGRTQTGMSLKLHAK